MRGKLQDRYSGIRTKRGGSLFRSNSRSQNNGINNNNDDDEVNAERSASTESGTGRGTLGNPEYLEKTRKKLADDSVALRGKRSNAIETFRNELQLSSSLPHYRVLELAYLDYKHIKNQLNQLLDQVAKLSHSQEIEPPCMVTDKQN